MPEIIVSTLILSLLHAAIPNHWMPVIAVAKAEKWTLQQSLSATLYTGFSHTLSTLLIGIIIGFAGYKLSEYFEIISHRLSAAILIILGIIYILADHRKQKHHHQHTHGAENIKSGSKSRGAVLFSLSLAMFLTPCVEIEAYYFRAGVAGWKGIIAASAVYVIVTVISMLLLVWLATRGVKNIRWHYMEHHDKLATGSVLLIIGLFALTGITL